MSTMSEQRVTKRAFLCEILMRKTLLEPLNFEKLAVKYFRSLSEFK